MSQKCGRTCLLGDVVLKALSFRGEDRYATPGQLKAALCSLPESAAIPAAAPVIPLSSEELKNAHSYKVDKNFEPAEPEKKKKKQPKTRKPEGAVDENMDAEEFRKTKKKGRWVLPVVLILVIIVALLLLLRGCNDNQNPAGFTVDPEPTVTENPIHSPVPTAELTLPESTETPEEPEETEPPEETEEPENKEPVYEVYLADVTWEEAKNLCDQKGGHLATIRDNEQYNTIIQLAERNGAQFVWLGAYRAENAQWYYVTGDTLDYTAWDVNEPSAMDNDGTREDYLLLCTVPPSVTGAITTCAMTPSPLHRPRTAVRSPTSASTTNNRIAKNRHIKSAGFIILVMNLLRFFTTHRVSTNIFSDCFRPSNGSPVSHFPWVGAKAFLSLFILSPARHP